MLTKEAVKEFLIYGSHSKPEFLYRQVHSVLGERFMGSGLVTEHISSLWEAKRSLFNPAFHRSYLKLSMETFNNSTEASMKRLKRMADGKTKVQMLDEFSRLTLDIIAKVGFGFDCESLTKERSKFNDAVTCSLNGCMYFERNFWQKYSLIPEVSTRRKQVKSAIRFLRDFGREIVTKRIQKMNEEKDDRHDILSYILKATNGLKDSSFGMTGVLDEFITFFVAGMETSSVTLTSILFHLSRSEETVKRLKAEVKEVLQDRTFVEYEDLAKLEYLNAVFYFLKQVIKETLRMTPPASATARQCNYDVEVSGYVVPKGCTVAVPFAMGRREEFFSDPLTFKPERFYRTMIEPHTFVPFAVGPRSCIGQQFALMEMKVIMARLLQTFDLRWVPDQSTDFIEEMTAKLKDGGLHYLTICDNDSAENDQL
ncbi:Cholesterol 24-hydroxylase [Holothuria leucospilota]|uniref:Cholesterol 24-hydroxylase n=1 Tax=Holothuria leucospilota TaxID=206669 RepID=A0A9Q1HGS5_HOLLE|nr:Cholesterol 24-hydroxylase [Holothuria leucospilota]